MFKAEIEGVVLTVCTKCKQFGKVVGRVREPRPPPKKQVKEKPQEPEVIEIVVSDYANLIKQKREKLNLKQEDLAKNIAEKESLIQKVESGHFTPSINLAHKLEHFLKIKLVENYKEESLKEERKAKGEGFTLGDFIKKK